MSFIHLHTHSHYSLLDGLSKIDDLVAKAKEYGMPALALTDHGNMYGAIEFYKKCKAADIKPIIGIEAYVAIRGRLDKEPNIDNRRYHLTLLAKNLAGYRNLIRLTTAAHLEGYYYKPRIDKELLTKHADGLICLSGCLGSELSQTLWKKDYEGAKKLVAEYQTIFGAENYFLEIMEHPGIERQTEIKNEIIKLAKDTGVPLVATCDSHYLNKEDNIAHDTLVAIQTGSDVGDNKMANKDEDFSFIDGDQAKKLFHDTPEAVANTLKVAELCENIDLSLGHWVFPVYEIPAGQTYDQVLDEKTKKALVEYVKDNPDRKEEAEKRIDYELDVIKSKGYSPYFLVVADLITFAHDHNIFTNTRGSAAGSMVSYLNGITNVDPLVYRLPFERFLNKDRPSPPDIDMDFADKRRDEVIDYTKRKYGIDKVAQIGTFGSMMARGAVRDIARALNFPYATGDKIARLIPMGSQGFPMTIERAVSESPELKELYEKDSEVKQVVDLAKKIEGGARHISVHAAGVVIAPSPLSDFVPVQYDPKGGKIITQYDMHSVEEAGLLKFDFLGIRNLSILEDSIRLVKKIHNLEIDIEKIPLDDRKAFALLARGETIGLFQLGGSGMTRWLKELKPSSILDINAMVALYRPGPMESIPEYIRREHNPKLVTYLDERMKDILDQSYGVITYQDDVMMISIKLAGYSWTEADKLRKAMGKKIPAEMKAQRKKLMEGLAANGMTQKKADELWKLIEPFAAYGFNKAHAASYGRVAYQTAYMKANYPTEFMTAILTAESGEVEKIAEVIVECRRMNIPVLPPDINKSFSDFTVIKEEAGQPDEIRFGLLTIKNLGSDIAEAIVSERKAGGPFKSLTDFLERITHKNLNRKSLEALIKSGAMDSLGENRGNLLANIEEALAYNRELAHRDRAQATLFREMTDKTSVPKLKLKEAPEPTVAERLAWEKELLGLYISGHPLDKFKEKFGQTENTIEYSKNLPDNVTTTIGGIIEEVKKITTRGGEQMAFIKLADYTNRIEAVCFSRLFEQYKDLLVPEKCVACRGKISRRNGEPSLLIEAVKLL